MLRGSEAAAIEEIKEYASTNIRGEVVKHKLFKNRIFWKSLILVVMITICTQLIGFNAVSFYLQSILESTKTSVEPEIASVVIGLIQLFASVCSTIVSDRFGRKAIMSITLLGMMMGMVRNQ
jgi:Na+/melibiose symporter-like transporter